MRAKAFMLFTLALLLGSLPVDASTPHFAPLPALSNQRSALKLRIVRYTGGTNGQMVVDVRNDGWKAHTFKPDGLYFVPMGNPEKAPQRLGAAGPFTTNWRGRWRHREQLRLQPHQTTRLKLQLFCIDSHRPSPSSTTPFQLARRRLPPRLRRSIESGTRRIMRARRAPSATAVKRHVQSHVWKTRNKKWIKLQGERAQEKGHRRQRHWPTPRPRQQQRRLE